MGNRTKVKRRAKSLFPSFPQRGTGPSPGAAYGANILNAKSILSVPQRDTLDSLCSDPIDVLLQH